MIFLRRAARSAAVLGRGTSFGGVAFVTLLLSFPAKASCLCSPLLSHLAAACGVHFTLTITRCFPETSGVRLKPAR